MSSAEHFREAKRLAVTAGFFLAAGGGFLELARTPAGAEGPAAVGGALLGLFGLFTGEFALIALSQGRQASRAEPPPASPGIG